MQEIPSTNFSRRVTRTLVELLNSEEARVQKLLLEPPLACNLLILGSSSLFPSQKEISSNIIALPQQRRGAKSEGVCEICFASFSHQHLKEASVPTLRCSCQRSWFLIGTALLAVGPSTNLTVDFFHFHSRLSRFQEIEFGHERSQNSWSSAPCFKSQERRNEANNCKSQVLAVSKQTHLFYPLDLIGRPQRFDLEKLRKNLEVRDLLTTALRAFGHNTSESLVVLSPS